MVVSCRGDHHSGLFAPTALDTLRQLARLEYAIAEAPRPYRVVVSSDHGRTQGSTFLQRYDMILEDLVDSLIDAHVDIAVPEMSSEGWGNSNGAGRRVYFPGDTDPFDGMADFGDIDVAFLPIWGWGSTLGEGHLNPQRAAAATSLVKPELLVPIHWGTYASEDGQRRLPRWFDTPPTELRTELDAIDELHRLGLVEPGDSFTVTSR